MYKGERVECGYRLDLLVEHSVTVELKAVADVRDIEPAQLLTYLKLSDTGLLINFNVRVLTQGIKRFVYDKKRKEDNSPRDRNSRRVGSGG